MQLYTFRFRFLAGVGSRPPLVRESSRLSEEKDSRGKEEEDGLEVIMVEVLARVGGGVSSGRCVTRAPPVIDDRGSAVIGD